MNCAIHKCDSRQEREDSHVKVNLKTSTERNGFDGSGTSPRIALGFVGEDGPSSWPEWAIGRWAWYWVQQRERENVN